MKLHKPGLHLLHYFQHSYLLQKSPLGSTLSGFPRAMFQSPSTTLQKATWSGVSQQFLTNLVPIGLNYSYNCNDETLCPKASQRGKGLLGLHFHSTAHRWWKSGQEVNREGIWRQELKSPLWMLLLPCLSWLAQPSRKVFEQPAQGWHSYSVLHQWIVKKMPYSEIWRRLFISWGSLLQLMLACFKLT